MVIISGFCDWGLLDDRHIFVTHTYILKYKSENQRTYMMRALAIGATTKTNATMTINSKNKNKWIWHHDKL